MKYALLIRSHPNIRYRVSLQKLAEKELHSILQALIPDEYNMHTEQIAAETFLVFETDREVDGTLLKALSRHSACALLSHLKDGTLIPLERKPEYSLSPEMPHILKYKGKTNPDFTFMLLHCALSASAFSRSGEALTVLDPMCGKGTTLFSALCEGCHAVGFETDPKEIAEGVQFTKQFLQYHKVKHKLSERSNTIQGQKPVRSLDFRICPDSGEQGLQWYHSDCENIPYLLKKESCHLAICDLPYGVQHAPKKDGKVSNLHSLTQLAAFSCAHALKNGGVLGFAFNTNTLPRKEVEQILLNTGFQLLPSEPWGDFSHWVEQAITRDAVFAIKDKQPIPI